ncbi:MAG TPA: FISUMP domain-containing protein [Bacteroidales bacterium]|nr:FISUMP domain-containing protein [Bacteroidales bacterium]HRZ50232.1 FISUMP domain-containing protein [Bacteroidales bacterium]
MSTDTVSNISQHTASSGGNITSDGGATITSRGVCWSTSPSPDINDDTTSNGTGTGSFTSNITGLNPSTTYYVRAYAVNSAGTAYGNQVDFTTSDLTTGTPCPGMPTMTDYNGNVYNTVQIGTQCWMKENLKTTKYNNGSAIPLVPDNNVWSTLSTPAYCWYNNDYSTYGSVHGALYNWFAVETGNLCPTGWHVPTDAEWTVLTDFLGGSNVAGGPLKETGTTHWNTPNTGATNSSGFTALPGGLRSDYDGLFKNIGIYGYWWSSSAYSPTLFWGRVLCYNNSGVTSGYDDNNYGLSVRCVKD